MKKKNQWIWLILILTGISFLQCEEKVIEKEKSFSPEGNQDNFSEVEDRYGINQNRVNINSPQQLTHPNFQEQLRKSDIQELVFLETTFKIEKGVLEKSTNGRDFQEVSNFEGDDQKIEPSRFKKVYIINGEYGPIWIAEDDEMDVWATENKENWKLETYGGGDGALEHPYEIANLRHLRNISKNSLSNFILTKNIILKPGEKFEPIEDFSGILDGQDQTIKGMSINRSQEQYVGLFRKLRGAEVKNLKLHDFKIVGKQYVGSLAGKAEGDTKIENVEVEYSKIQGKSPSWTVTGGLVGWMRYGTIENSLFDGEVVGRNNLGGFVGLLENGLITKSEFRGKIKGYSFIGGLVGHMRNGEIHGNESKAEIIGLKDNIGGLIGQMDLGHLTTSRTESPMIQGRNSIGGAIGLMNNGTVDTISIKGEVQGNDKIGGVAGWLRNGNISRSETDMQGSGNTIGGFIGFMNGGLINNSFAVSNIRTPDHNAGGFIGKVVAGTVANSAASGKVRGKRLIGGFIGSIFGGTISHSYSTTDSYNKIEFNGAFIGYVWQRGPKIIYSHVPSQISRGKPFAYNQKATKALHNSGFLPDNIFQELIVTGRIGPVNNQ